MSSELPESSKNNEGPAREPGCGDRKIAELTLAKRITKVIRVAPSGAREGEARDAPET